MTWVHPTRPCYLSFPISEKHLCSLSISYAILLPGFSVEPDSVAPHVHPITDAGLLRSSLLMCLGCWPYVSITLRYLCSTIVHHMHIRRRQTRRSACVGLKSPPFQVGVPRASPLFLRAMYASPILCISDFRYSCADVFLRNSVRQCPHVSHANHLPFRSRHCTRLDPMCSSATRARQSFLDFYTFTKHQAIT